MVYRLYSIVAMPWIANPIRAVRFLLQPYLNNNLRKDNPTGKNSLMTDIGGDLQSVLIARRVVSRCNTLIEQGYITKKNGESLQVTIGEDIMKKAGLGDPSAS